MSDLWTWLPIIVFVFAGLVTASGIIRKEVEKKHEKSKTKGPT